VPAIFAIGVLLRTFSGFTLAFIFASGPAIAAGVAHAFGGEVADAFALDFIQADGRGRRADGGVRHSTSIAAIHQDGDQSRGFYGGIPAVDVVRGVGFGDAEVLRFLQRGVEGEAFFHLAQDHVGGGIQDAVEALQADGRELIEEGKNWDAIHHGRLEEEAFAFSFREIAEFAVGVDDGAFVGGDGVGSVLESGADVVDGRLSGFDVERCGFEENVGAGGGEPVVEGGGLLRRFPAVSGQSLP
jgi:hypothetical protein